MPRPSSAPYRALTGRLKRLATRETRAPQLAPTTDTKLKSGETSTPDNGSAPPPVVNLSLNYPAGGRLRLYLDFDKNPPCTKHDLSLRAQHRYPWTQRERARRARGGIARNQLRQDKGMSSADRQSHDIRYAISTDKSHGDHLETKKPSLLDERVHETSVFSTHTTPSQGEEETHVTDICVSKHDVDSDVTFAPSPSQRDARESEQSEAQVTPCCGGVDITERDSIDTAVASADDPIIDELSAMVEETTSSEVAREQSDVLPSLHDFAVYEAPAGNHEPGESNPASTSQDKAAESILQPVQRFQPYNEGSRGGSIVSKLLQPPSRSIVRPGCIYIFRRDDAPGLLKIGCTARSVMERLRYWDKCGLEPILVHNTHHLNFYRRAESLIHLELADVRCEESCPRCGKTHTEWFRISEGQAIQVVDSWADIFDQHKLYDVNGRINTTWTKVITDLEQEGTVINAESLLRQYKQSQDSEASEHMDKISGQNPGLEHAPFLTTTPTDLPTSESSDVVVAPDPDRLFLLEALPTALMAVTNVDRDLFPEAAAHPATQGHSQQDTQQQEAQRGTSEDRALTGPMRLLLLASPRAQLLLPPPSTIDVFHSPISTSTSDFLPQKVREDEPAIVSTAAVDQADDEKAEYGNAPKPAQKPCWFGMIGVLFTLAAVDAYFGFYGGQVWILVS